MRRYALVLLGLYVLRHHVWPAMPAELQTSAWTLGGCVVTLVALAATTLVASWLGAPLGPTLAVAGWWAADEIVTAACEIAYILHPLVPTGDERCTAQIGVKIGMFGTLAVALLLIATDPASSDSGAKRGGADNDG